MDDFDYLYGPLFFQKVFSREECKKIIAMQGNTKSSEVSFTENTGGVDKAFRSSVTKQLFYKPENKWLSDKLASVITQVNKTYYNFLVNNITGFHVLEYNKDDFFSWHQDIGPGNTSNRKISIIIFLSDPRDYKGGQLKWIPDTGEIKKNPEQGTVLVFPSYVPHKVEKIESGRRYSLVAWATGPCFQ
jgi:PKHD-type hydroxylase